MYQTLRKIIKFTASFLIFYTGIGHVYLRYVYPRRKTFPVVIINYHRFVKDLNNVIDADPAYTHHIDDFKKELGFLKKYFDIVSLDQAVETLKQRQCFVKPTVAITVDDGFADNYELLFPVIRQENVPITIFLIDGFIGTNQKAWFDQLASIIKNTNHTALKVQTPVARTYSLNSLTEKRKAYLDLSTMMKDMSEKDRKDTLDHVKGHLDRQGDDRPVMLSWEQVKTMSEQGVAFGSHTCTHPILTSVPVNDAKSEILQSKKSIEQKLGMAVKHFAFPNGRPRDFNDELRQYCQEIGFKSISSCEKGCNFRALDVWSLKRIHVAPPLSVFSFGILRVLLSQKY